MKHIKKGLTGTIDKFPEKHIYLNVTHLEKGVYVLNIIHKNKIVKSTTFKK